MGKICYFCSYKEFTMTILKKLDMFILKKFLWVFFGSFFITLFVFMMQFTWRYVDELIGKGLTVDILAEFFWYMGLSLVPTSLPLAILLASLISFGNMGEQLELLAMKAAGVSLLRIMRPILVLVIFLTGTSFYFQNKTAPEAQLKLRTLLLSMKQTSPALEIPEGVFYNGIPNLNLFVEHKEISTGMLYNLMVYKTDEGFDKAQIVVADSGRMEVTADRMHLILDIWNGEQFENLQSNMSVLSSPNGTPYDRETFKYKKFIIDFDSNFEKMDEEQLRGMASAKNLTRLRNDIDSMETQLDSVGKSYYAEAESHYYRHPKLNVAQNKLLKVALASRGLNFDSLLAHTSPERLQSARQMAQANAAAFAADLEWRSAVTNDGDHFIRTHWIEWHRKFTLSLACLFFFFVGAPLGAIIRKGGLGLPTVISVIIFIFYYIIDTSSMKMARDGSLNMTYGMWISSAILAPLGAYLTYKSNNDSVVFNWETYQNILMRFFGWRTPRHLFRKEVIIDTPDYARLSTEIPKLREYCRNYKELKHLQMAPNYIRAFFRPQVDRHAERISNELEAIVEELSNTRSSRILSILNTLPVIYIHAHTSPFVNRKLNILCGIIFPMGFLLWLRIWRFRFRLNKDLKRIDEALSLLEQYVREEMKQQECSPLDTITPNNE